MLTPIPKPYLSRRAFLYASLAGAAFLAGPKSLRAAELPRNVTALAFESDALLVAGETLLRSDDGDASWASVSAPNGGGILALATHPVRPGRVVAGLAKGGVAVSEDSGRVWEPRGKGLPDAAVIAVAVAAAEPDIFYAALRGDGLWQSEDTGRSWTFVMDRPWLADGERDPTALASVDLATGMGGIWIYAGTEAGLTRVPDCFCRWQDVRPGNAMDALVSGDAPPSEAPLPAGEPIRALTSAPSASGTLHAALPSGVWTSRDAGIVWSRTAEGDATAVAVNPANSNHIVAALNGGLTQSRDGGITWSALAVI
ncbi:exo-alpha-sialidase [uncultured Jannaschia sp.]|uniref:WD40/YVTN/BNR-like repeat-containing protein n=1 Tax=uncultured Jannaschia sp. TaxID=293347 RepID=UPI002617F2C2|nr:exo-alpha-sialidase [uncultured Jannaschia sp.]